MFKKLVNKLFGRGRKTTDSIVAPLTKMVDDLRDHIMETGEYYNVLAREAIHCMDEITQATAALNGLGGLLGFDVEVKFSDEEGEIHILQTADMDACECGDRCECGGQYYHEGCKCGEREEV
jgi:hypothetical protein